MCDCDCSCVAPAGHPDSYAERKTCPQHSDRGTVAWDYFITCRCAGVRDAQDCDLDECHAFDCPYHGCYRYGCVPGKLHRPDCPNSSRNPYTGRNPYTDTADEVARLRLALEQVRDESFSHSEAIDIAAQALKPRRS